ncbi:male accessory gland serine protease inhibitor-like [Drosophila pseudoobscura]|uniref:Male accessory gland serine protease inhibitor-like n=1 Tax=Drosophila pseudoobscura pseudoobscura TaxID=46245 RepID=A0A6I8V8J9_DROPS|nr:male accessory gland serine protease inhibitor [Drosophila pseudoobscura]
MILVFIVGIIFAWVWSGAALRLKNPICGLPATSSRFCHYTFDSFTYDPKTNECEMFVYSGCGGNENLWGQKELCEMKCKV